MVICIVNLSSSLSAHLLLSRDIEHVRLTLKRDETLSPAVSFCGTTFNVSDSGSTKGNASSETQGARHLIVDEIDAIIYHRRSSSDSEPFTPIDTSKRFVSDRKIVPSEFRCPITVKCFL